MGRAQFGAKFFHEVCDEVFHEVFGLVLLGYSEQQKTSATTSALNSHDSAQQNWRNFREKLHDEVLQGDPRQVLPKGRSCNCLRVRMRERG